MSIEVLSQETVPIRREDDVFLARRHVRQLADRTGFDTFAAAAITTAASELGRNTWVHGGGGELIIEVVRDGLRVGLQLSFRDEGPGIEDVPRVLAGGHSTMRSLGLGVSGSRRLVDEFSLESTPGVGTRVTCRKWKRF